MPVLIKLLISDIVAASRLYVVERVSARFSAPDLSPLEIVIQYSTIFVTTCILRTVGYASSSSSSTSYCCCCIIVLPSS